MFCLKSLLQKVFKNNQIKHILFYSFEVMYSTKHHELIRRRTILDKEKRILTTKFVTGGYKTEDNYTDYNMLLF